MVHHLFSYEIEVHSQILANAIWSMEDWIDRSAEAGTTDGAAPFRTMRGSGHYHVGYEKDDLG